jgi:hypothetical protein
MPAAPKEWGACIGERHDKKTASNGAINQIGKCLSCIIHKFDKAEGDAKVFSAK